MKWVNKGKELEIIGKKFNPETKVYLYGAAELGKAMFDCLKFLDCVEGFIDNNKLIQRKGYCNKKVDSVLRFVQKIDPSFCEHHIIIICMSDNNARIVIKQLQLLSKGLLCEGINLFSYSSFLNYHFSFFAMYSYHKLVIEEINIATTLRCTLNCKNYLACIPSQTDKKDFPIEMLKRSIDAFFNTVDYVLLMEIAGGEPLLYTNLLELIHYIGENYRNQIKNLRITTNGTIVPSDELCYIARKYNIIFMIDDYSENVPDELIRICEIKEKLENYNNKYFLYLSNRWIDMQLGKTNNSILTEEELGNYFTACQYNCMQLHDEKLFNCGYSLFALLAGLTDNEELGYSLTRFPSYQNKLLLFEYSKGFSEKGYIELCKKCAGHYAINQNSVKVAEQVN